MINKIIRNFIAKQMAGRSDDGIMITLRDPQKVELAENIMADLLMRNGIDPRAITSEQQLKNIINQIDAASKQTTQSGIKNTESAKVFNTAGEELDPSKPIMGGTQQGKKINQDFFIRNAESQTPPPGSRGGPDDIAAPVQSSEESLKNMIIAENKKNISAMKNRKMIKDSVENASPGFVKGDRKYNAQLVADDLADKKFGKEFYDLDQKQQMDLYDEALEGLSEQTRGMPDPEDFAKGGIARIGLKDGISLESILENDPLKDGVPMKKDGFFIRPDFDKMTPEQIEIYKIRNEIMKKGFEKKLSPEGLEKLKIQRQIRDQQRKDRGLPEFIELMANGGRIGLKDGMNRRTFLKIFSGLVSLPIIGKVLKPLKVGKTVTKVPIIKTDNVPGKPEWFDQLVNKVILEGDDMTKQFATKEREIVHATKIGEDDYVRVTQDLDEGAVRVEYESPENMYGDSVLMKYKKPLPDEDMPRGGAAEFNTAESGPVGRAFGPDDYEIEIDELGGTSISDLTSDVSKLKQYATGKKPTLKEIVQIKKRKDRAASISEGGANEMDEVVRRQGDYVQFDDIDPDPGDFASGGIARMLGE